MNQRLALALAGFDKLNSHLPDDAEVHYAPEPGWNLRGSMQAIVRLLVAKGLVDEMELTLLIAIQQMEVVEEGLTNAREHLRETTGIIVPLGMSTRPQG